MPPILPKGKREDWPLPRSPPRQVSSRPDHSTTRSWGDKAWHREILAQFEPEAIREQTVHWDEFVTKLKLHASVFIPWAELSYRQRLWTSSSNTTLFQSYFPAGTF